MTALNWSPGGCCCPADSLYDIYGIPDYVVSTGHPLGLVRQPTMHPTDSFFDNSKDRASTDNWYIPTQDAVTVPADHFTIGTVVGGYETDREFVWALETRDGEYYLVRYDAVAREEVFALWLGDTTVVSTSYLDLLTHNNPNNSYSQDTLMGLCTVPGPETGFPFLSETDGRFVLQADGTWEALGYVNKNNVTTGEVISLFALRHFPWAAGEDASGLFICTAEDLVVNGTFGNFRRNFVVTDKTYVTGFVTADSWIHFDASPTNWAGVIRDTSSDEYSLVINDDIIFTRYQGTDISQPHVAHPHETLGDGWVIVGMKDYSVEPTSGSPSGTLADAALPYIGIAYHNGVEAWRTPRRTFPVIPKTSSDRWLYMSGWQKTTSPLSTEMTGTVHSGSGYHASGRSHWLIKHDGSQAAACGTGFGSSNGVWPNTTIAGAAITVRHMFGRYGYGGGSGPDLYVAGGTGKIYGLHDCVKNSALVTGSLPADATTWDDIDP